MDPLRKLGIRVCAERLEFGDVSFLINTSHGVTSCGIEFKTLYDVLGCIGSGRFAAHQLPGLLDTYGAVILLIQGQYRSGTSGSLRVKRGKAWSEVPFGRRQWKYVDLAHWLWSIRFAGVTVIETPDLHGSAAAIKALYTWGQKEWDQHKTLKVLHTPPERMPQVRPTRLKRMAADIQGIGWERASAVAAHFQTPRAMANATEAEWREIEGIDRILAKRAVRTMTVAGVK